MHSDYTTDLVTLALPFLHFRYIYWNLKIMEIALATERQYPTPTLIVYIHNKGV